jgi:ketosteroid isomerase-like protein
VRIRYSPANTYTLDEANWKRIFNEKYAIVLRSKQQFKIVYAMTDKESGNTAENLETIVREFEDAYVRKDVERMTSFFADDAAWIGPEGTFTGRDEVRRYLTWYANEDMDLRVSETGIGIAVKGSRAVFQCTIEATMPNGVKWEAPSTSVYEFRGKLIERKTVCYDRLSIAKQVARGFLDRFVVNLVVDRFEKGLRG